MSSPKPPSTASPRASPKTTPASLPGAAPAAKAGGKEGKADKNAAKAAKEAAKAARRAEAIAAKNAGGATGAAPLHASSGSHGGAGPSGGAGGKQGGAGGAEGTPRKAAGANNQQQQQGQQGQGQKGRDKEFDPLQPFLHLKLPTSSSSLSHTSKSTVDIHPAILRLALQYAEFKVVGANARCIAMLNAFKEVIASYSPPAQTSLTRHLPNIHLGPQISHLIRARPLSVSMGNAIRYLKSEIGLIPMEADPEESKALLNRKIDSFIRDRILLAGKVIEQAAIDKIKDGETLLTYARSSVVEGVLLEAKRQGRAFSVVVVDSRPLYEGKNLLAALKAAGIPTTYVLLPSLSLVLPRVDLCLLGTNALLSNGAMFARAGTAMVAMMLREKGVPVICCCETYKFSERIMLDSIVGNEMASPLPLLAGLPEDATAGKTPVSPLNLLYDVARPEDVSVVATEAGLIPVESVPVLLRDYKPLMQGGM